MSATDVMVVGIVIFAIGLAFAATHYMINTSIDAMIGVGVVNESQPAVDALEVGKDLTGRFDYVVLTLFIMLIIGIMVTSWFIAGSPVFMFLYFLVIILSVTLSAVFSNVWDDALVKSVALASGAGAMPITSHIIGNLPYYLGVIGFMGMIVMFARGGKNG